MFSDDEYDNLAVKLVAKRVVDNKYIHASVATKEDGPFYCPDTFEEVIVRKCIEKVDHFAYKARLSPVPSKESLLHLECKQELLAVLQKQFPEGKWEVERDTFQPDKSKGYEKVKPDLSGRINGAGVIIEVQASSLSINKIIHRTLQYSKRGAYILWVVPLEEELGENDFRPRLFERYLHTLYYGKVYYWYRGSGTILTPVHFGTASRYVEESHWFESDGTERNEGGYYKPFLRVKTPIYGPPIDILTDFIVEVRPKFELENDKLSIPSCKICRDIFNTPRK